MDTCPSAPAPPVTSQHPEPDPDLDFGSIRSGDTTIFPIWLALEYSRRASRTSASAKLTLAGEPTCPRPNMPASSPRSVPIARGGI